MQDEKTVDWGSQGSDCREEISHLNICDSGYVGAR